eukprot:Lithocolla_globosa_v1_NODE_277_length_4701_cov_11.244081.p1 type:complete len:945 gc:universal NODE_277_length_4701_cov_11.244081:4573-1739(-)
MDSKEHKPLLPATDCDTSIGNDEGSSQDSWFQRVASSVDTFLSSAFYSLGFWNALHPKLMIFLSFFVCGLGGIGFIWFEEETRTQALWIPAGSCTNEHAAFYSIFFSADPRVSEVILTMDERNLLTEEHLLQALLFHERVLQIQVIDEDNEIRTFETLCFRDFNDECRIDSILSQWNYNASLIEVDPMITETLSSLSLWDLQTLLGDLVMDDNQVVSASAIRNYYSLTVGETSELWENEFLRLLSENDHVFDVVGQAERSLLDEFGNGLENDIVLLSVSIVLIFFFLMLVLGECSRLKSRSLLAMGGIVTVAMSIVFSSMIGFEFNYVIYVLPFVVIAIGVNNNFILFNAFQSTDVQLPLEQRSAIAMGHAGVSVTVSSLTNVAAFAIGCTSSLPALTAFCVYAAVAIISLFFFQMTWFVCIMVLDERRVLSNRADCCCLCCPCGVLSNDEDLKRYLSIQHQTLLGKYLETSVGPFLTHPIVKCCMLLFALGLLSGGMYCALQLTISDYLNNAVPEDSYLQDLYAIQDQYFVDNGENVDIVITERTVSYYDMQDLLENLPQIISSNKFIQNITNDTWSSWYDSYLFWLQTESDYQDLLVSGRPPDSNTFLIWLEEFLKVEQGQPFQEDVNLLFQSDASDPPSNETKENATTLLITSRMRAHYIPLVSTLDEVDAMRSLRAQVFDFEYESFPWSFSYIEWEQNAVVSDETARNLGLAFGVVFLITLILLANFFLAGLVMLMVASTIIMILGGMYLWGLSLDSVTVVNLVLAIGLSVDYTVHMAHCFMLKKGTRNERVIQAYGDIAVGVLCGATATLLAVLVLAFSSSYVFVVLFRQFLLVVIFGVFHGMIVLPILLSLVGPEPYKSKQRTQPYKESGMEHHHNQLVPCGCWCRCGDCFLHADTQMGGNDSIDNVKDIQSLKASMSRLYTENEVLRKKLEKQRQVN